MKNRIEGRLTAAQLESNFRAQRRASGEKLYIVDTSDWGNRGASEAPSLLRSEADQSERVHSRPRGEGEGAERPGGGVNRLKNKAGIVLLNVAIAALHASGKCKLLSDRCTRLQQKIAPVANDSEEYEPVGPAEHPDKYTLDLIAWRGDDGENEISFDVTESERAAILAVGPVQEDDDDYGKYPLSALAKRLVWKVGELDPRRTGSRRPRAPRADQLVNSGTCSAGSRRAGLAAASGGQGVRA